MQRREEKYRNNFTKKKRVVRLSGNSVSGGGGKIEQIFLILPSSLIGDHNWLDLPPSVVVLVFVVTVIVLECDADKSVHTGKEIVYREESSRRKDTCCQNEPNFESEKGRQDADSGIPDDYGREVR